MELSDWKQSDDIKELAAALAEAQGEMTPAKKTSDNPYFKSKYADLAEIVEVLKPVLPKHGISVIQLPGVVGSLTTQIMHKSGQWIRQTATVRLSKEDPQSVGSGITYMRRYSLSGVGVATEDDDGNTHIPGRKGGQNPYKVAQAVQNGQNVAEACAVVFKYDLKEMHEDKKEAAESYLQENDAVFDDEALVWESAKPLKKLDAYRVR